MIRLFKAELYKLFKNRSFKVVCIIAAILSTLMLAMSVSLSEDLAKSSMKNLSEKEITEQIENIRQEEKSDTPITAPLLFKIVETNIIIPTTALYDITETKNVFKIVINWTNLNSSPQPRINVWPIVDIPTWIAITIITPISIDKNFEK